MYNKNYLTKRPFMVVTVKFQPAPGANTSVKNWAETAGWQSHEDLSFVDRVKPRHLDTATLIIDILEAKVVKNGFVESSKDEVMKYYVNKYKKQISDTIGAWMESEAQKRAAEERLMGEPA